MTKKCQGPTYQILELRVSQIVKYVLGARGLAQEPKHVNTGQGDIVPDVRSQVAERVRNRASLLKKRSCELLVGFRYKSFGYSVSEGCQV